MTPGTKLDRDQTLNDHENDSQVLTNHLVGHS